MPSYHYKVCDLNGKLSEVTVDAESLDEALRRLRHRSLKPISLVAESMVGEKNRYGLRRLFSGSFDPYEFTESLVPLLKAQVPLEKSLAILSGDDNSANAPDVAMRIRIGLIEGKQLSEMVRFHGSLFPPLYADLVEAGERSGALVEVMEQLLVFLKTRRELREFLITSSIYPVIILVVTFGVIALLFTVFLPKFAQVFADMNKELPTPTAVMISLSEFISNVWWLWVLILGVGLLMVQSMIRRGVVKPVLDELLVRTPITRSIILSLEISRFFRTLSVLVRNHIHLLDGVSIASRVIQNGTVKRTLNRISSDLREGGKLSVSLSKSHFVPRIAIQMIKVGEESGQLSGMLEQIALRYESIVRTKIKRLLALFEPLVILFLSGIVLAVVLAVFMAVFEMSNI